MGAPDIVDVVWFTRVSALLAGAAFGSFLSVVYDRVPDGRSLGGRSECRDCGERLAVRDLVPIVSWISLRGRCRHCRRPIPRMWLGVEVATATIFTVAAWRGPVRIWPVFVLAPFVSILLVLSLIDVRVQRLPNRIVYPTAISAALVVLAGSMLGAPLVLGNGLIGAAGLGGGLLLIAVASGGGMGIGDVKLGAVIGLVVGAVDLPSVAVAAAVAILLGGVVGAVLLLAGAHRRASIPFGPMLSVGATISLLWGAGLSEAYLRFLR